MGIPFNIMADETTAQPIEIAPQDTIQNKPAVEIPAQEVPVEHEAAKECSDGELINALLAQVGLITNIGATRSLESIATVQKALRARLDQMLHSVTVLGALVNAIDAIQQRRIQTEKMQQADALDRHPGMPQ